MLLTGLRVGDRLPVNCTSLRKVLLGFAGESARAGFMASMAPGSTFHARTERTIVDHEKLMELFEGVEHEGYALDIEECEAGMCCAAAPVRDASGQVVGALSISGPASRLSPKALETESSRGVVSAGAGLWLDGGLTMDWRR